MKLNYHRGTKTSKEAQQRERKKTKNQNPELSITYLGGDCKVPGQSANATHLQIFLKHRKEQPQMKVFSLAVWRQLSKECLIGFTQK